MVLAFAPLSNDSNNPCQGVKDYQLSRPPASSGFYEGNLATFIFLVILFFFSILWFWVHRERLSPARPFTLNLIFCLSGILFSVSSAYNIASPNVPCWLLLFGCLIGLGGLCNTLGLRAIVFLCESTFALQASNYKLDFDADTKSVASATTSQFRRVVYVPASTISSVSSLILFGLGFQNMDQISMANLVSVKNSYGTMLLVTLIPFILVFIIVISVVPPYQSCSNCAIFLEIPPAFLSSLLLAQLLAIRMVYVSFKLKFPDSYGILREVFIMAIFNAPLAGIAWILIMVDPNDIEFNQQFMFEWIMSISLTFFWFGCCGIHMVNWHCKSRTTEENDYHIDSHDFMALLEDDEELKKDFEEYNIHLYAAENFYFVSDVMSYKKYFSEKAESWKTLKAKTLLDTYILENSVMQVNLSSGTRNRTMQQVEKCLDNHLHLLGLQNAFDEAEQQIINDILRINYVNFQQLRRTQLGKKKKSNGLIASLTGS